MKKIFTVIALIFAVLLTSCSERYNLDELEISDTNTAMAEVSSPDAFVSVAMELFLSLSRIILDDYDRRRSKLSSKVDKKLLRTIEKKNQMLGIKTFYIFE